MRDSVVVTGLGPVSAIGCGRDAFWEALCAGRPGFGPITLCDAGDSPSKVAAEVKGFALADYIDSGKVLARHMPRPTQLALAAAVLALHDAEIDLDACDPDRIGEDAQVSGEHIGFGDHQLQRCHHREECQQQAERGDTFKLFRKPAQKRRGVRD